MTKEIFLDRAPLYFRALISLVLVEVINEIIDQILLHAGLLDNSLAMHLFKLAIFFGLSLPIVLYWFYQDYQRLRMTQQKLADNEQDYRSLFDHNPNAMFLLDTEGNYLSINPSYTQITGYTEEDVFKKARHLFVTSTNCDQILPYFEDACHGQARRCEVAVVNKFGVDLEVDVTYIPMVRDGNVVGVYALAQDITERKRAEQELQKTQNILNSFIENTSDAIIFFDRKLAVTRINKGFENLYGWNIEEMQGFSVNQLIPKDHAFEVDQILKIVLEGNTIPSMETSRQTKSGRLIDISLTVSPIRDSEGCVIGAVGVSRDISVKKQMERELEDLEIRFESVIEHSVDAISMVDTNGNLLLANPAWERLYGWKVDEVLGKTSPTASKNKYFAEILNEATTVSAERMIERKDGSTVDVSISASPVFDRKGKTVGISFISKNMSERNRNEEIARRSEKLAVLGDLAAGLAHEIRNPLTSIQGFLQLMRTQFKEEYLNILLSETRRINQLTDELLMLAKPQIELQRQTQANAADMVHEAIRLMEAHANLYSVAIQTSIPDALPPIPCVPSQIKQVLINLVKNSIEAMPNGGNISVEVQSTEDGINITVCDEGNGIDPNRLESLGQPFYTTKERGTGLGLMISYRIIQNHNGTIHVESQVGSGTKFSIFLPSAERN